METNTNYTAEIIETSKELSPIERFRVKDMTAAISLDEATRDGAILLDYSYYAHVHINNPKSKKEQEYDKIVIADTADNLYVTGSESFMQSLRLILEELKDVPGWMLQVYQVPSKNYEGRNFLTCSVVMDTVE